MERKVRWAPLQIIRPLNLIIAGISIYVGGAIGLEGVYLTKPLLMAIASGIFLAAGSYVLNDYFDIEIDSINKPRRPLPCGKISKSSAFVASIILFFFGIAIGWPVGLTEFALSIVISVLMVLYSAKLKKKLLSGNLVVAIVTHLFFLYGGLAVNDIYLAMIPGVFSFFFHLGREIIKDVEDYEGDIQFNSTTLPIVLGKEAALQIASLVFAGLILLTPLPYIFNIFNLAYLLIVIVGVDLLLIVIIYYLIKNPSQSRLAEISVWLKLDMFVGLVAVYVGSL